MAEIYISKYYSQFCHNNMITLLIFKSLSQMGKKIMLRNKPIIKTNVVDLDFLIMCLLNQK
jgi:hypothetical protein